MVRSKHGWLRFSLRSLLALVTLVAVWFGYEVHVVRQRKAALAELRRDFSAAVIVIVADGAEQRWGPLNSDPHAPGWLRRLMGDKRVVSIGIYIDREDVVTSKQAELARLFPEANITRLGRPLEPCHPGCFPAGTWVDTPHGRQPIEAISAGQLVWSIARNGERTPWPVEAVFCTTNRLWLVTTAAGRLTTTETQPLRLPDGGSRGAGALRPGDQVLWFDGQTVRLSRVLQVQATPSVAPVYNLVLGDQQSFIAGGFVVRSKPPQAASD